MERFRIYYLTDSFIGKIIRVILAIAAVLSVYYLNMAFLIVVALVLINELFIESLKTKRPKFELSEKTDNPEDYMIFSARSAFLKANSVFEFIKSIQSKKEIEFFKEEIVLENVPSLEIKKNDLLNKSIEIARSCRGKYLVEIDFFASYILLSESETKFLLKNNLTHEDLLNMVFWTRKKFNLDNFKTKQLKLMGQGVFDFLVYSWNYELKKYSRDVTSAVLSKKFPPIITGREKEYEEFTVALSKKTSSNVLIIGESGTGNNSIVEFFAYSSFFGDTPKGISHKKVYEVFVDKLLSGVNAAGELEQRLNYMLEEISHSDNAIVLIENIENIFGGGGFNFDMSGVLDEYLNGDKIKIVGTTTQFAYESFIEPKTTARDLFEKVSLSEMDTKNTLLFLMEKAEETENKYSLKIKYSALKQIVALSPLYFPDRFFPGRAADLLESVASKVSNDKTKIIDEKNVTEVVQGKTNIILANPDTKEKDLLMHLEEKMHKRVIGQNEAIGAVAKTIRRLRSGFKNENKPISVMLFLGPTGVGKTETAKALAAEYFGDEKSMIRLDMSEYQTQDQLKRILGESAGEEVISNTLSDKVEQNPFSLILLDEFEKAHPRLLDVFLQVFDEARLTDNRGKTVSFKNTIIIATSNAGSEFIREKINNVNEELKKELINYLLQNNIFKPELMNRFDEVILFKPLIKEEIAKISSILLSESLQTLEDNQIKIRFDQKVIEKIVNEAYDSTYGARNVRRYIEASIEDYLSKLILADKIKKGEEKTLSTDQSGNYIIV